jgi:hypothetical protein
LPPGTYQVAVQGRPLQTLTSHGGEDQQVRVAMESNGASITITREKSSASATLLGALPDRASPKIPLPNAASRSGDRNCRDRVLRMEAQ